MIWQIVGPKNTKETLKTAYFYIFCYKNGFRQNLYLITFQEILYFYGIPCGQAVFFESIFVPINKFWKVLAGKIFKKTSFDVVHGPKYFRL